MGTDASKTGKLLTGSGTSSWSGVVSSRSRERSGTVDRCIANVARAINYTLPRGGSEMSVSEFPGRVVGRLTEPPFALPEGSFLAFDPPSGRVNGHGCLENREVTDWKRH